MHHHHATTIAVAVTSHHKNNNASHHHRHHAHPGDHLLGCSGWSARVDVALLDGGVAPPLVPVQHMPAQGGLDSQLTRVMAVMVMAVDDGETQVQLW